MKILLIESDGAFAQQLSRALALRGLETRTTGDGREALEVARAERPDAIVLCVELAGMSGYSTCNRLRKDGELKSVPLVITSAEATAETFEAHRRLKTRADGYLLKPFTPAQLLELLAGMVELPAAPPQGRAASRSATSREDDLRLIEEAFDRVAPDEHVAGRASPRAGLDQEAELVPEVEIEVEPLEPLEPADRPPVQSGPKSTKPAEPDHRRIERMEVAEADAALDALGAGPVEEPPALDLASASAMLDGGALGRQPDRSPQLQEAEERARELESRLQVAEERARTLEQSLRAAEDRVVRASQRLRLDELVREKARKALAIALQLLEERPAAPAPDEVQRRRE